MYKDIQVAVSCNRCGRNLYEFRDTFDVSNGFSCRFNITDDLMSFVAYGCSSEGGGQICNNRHFFISVTATTAVKVVEENE